jgi:tetratricopeptide (TPR) repeat protein
MKKILSFLILASICQLGAQSYPLSENTWSNPEFVDRFLGSFGVDTDISPSVSQEEGQVFREVSRVAGSNPNAAVRLLRNALTPDSSAALDFALANFLLQQRQYGSAIASFQNAIRKFPNFGRAYKNLGLAYIQQNNFRDALPNLTKALEILGGDGGLFGLIGFCHLNLERFGPALDAYRFALVFEPDSRDWRLGQLKALQSLRKYDEVESLIYRYIEERPNEPEFWLQQANAFIAQRKYAEAAANLAIVEMLGASDTEMLVLLGDIYVNLRAPTLAIAPYEKALGSGELEAAEALNLAQVLRRLLPADQMRDFLQSITDAYREMPAESELTLLTLRAGNALMLGETEEAMALLSDVVAKDPLNGSALLTLGGHYLAEEEFEKALDYFDRAQRVEAVKLDALVGSARVLVKLREYSQAIYRLKEAQLIEDQAHVAQYINTLENFVN